MKKFARISNWLYVIILAITPFLGSLIIEISCNPEPNGLVPLSMAMEILIVLLIEVFLVGLIPCYSIGLTLCYVFCLLFGTVNFYLLKFRDIPFMLMDIWDATTAAAVMKSYDFTPGKGLVVAVVITVVTLIVSFITFKWFWRGLGKKIKYPFWLSGGAIAGVVFTLIISFFGFSGGLGITMDLWKPGKTYKENGALTSFICYAQFSTIGEPEGYDKSEVYEVLRNAEKEYDKKYGHEPAKPKVTVISIMNEAYGDLSVLGPLKCTDDHMVFYKSLKNDPGTIWHGYSYVSTYAGGTARTEFEWLTGFSMRMFSNAQPYSQFNFDDIATPIKSINNAGYETIAMHPENARNYRRNTAYEQMGFDRFLSREDFRGYEKVKYIKTRTSDAGDFRRMMDEDEKNDNPKFFHNVTMQNHGGYEFSLNGEGVSVDEEYSNVQEFIKYESLLAMSDEALEELINYYRDKTEPVIICMYGDHLPTMPEKFVTTLMEKGYNPEKNHVENQERRFKVPFVMWANFPVEDAVKGYYHDGELVTSPNFLGVVTRRNAGLPLSAFDKYMLLLREKIPVINESGFVADGEWHAGNEESKYRDLLNEYMCVQYAGMFDIDDLEGLYGMPVE